MEAAAISGRTVELAASELPAFITALPRLLMEHLTVKVTGTLTEQVMISSFYGSGSITVQAAGAGAAVFRANARVRRCSVPVYFNGIRFEDYSPGNQASRTGISAELGSVVYADNCSFSSTNGGESQNLGYKALSASEAGAIYTTDLSASGCAVVAMVMQGGTIVCVSADAAAFRNNVYGAYTYWGGIVLLARGAPDLLGGSTNSCSKGGLIVGGAGSLLTA